jgi:hypothetical protein
MKKSVLSFSLLVMLIISGMNFAFAQEQPQPKKDTVNMDTQAKPQVYYPVEDENSAPSKKGGFPVAAIIAGVVVIVGAAAFFVLKKKK